MEATVVSPDRVEGTIVAVERMLPGCPRTEATFTVGPIPPNPESFAAAREGVAALLVARPVRKWTRGQKRERKRILGAVASTVCARQSETPCPAPERGS